MQVPGAQGAEGVVGLVQVGVGAAQLVLQQGHLLQVQAQAPARRRAGAGGAALHQHLAHAFLQLLDALRHGRGRDVQAPRGALEAALAQHGGQGFESSIVEHEVLLNMG